MIRPDPRLIEEIEAQRPVTLPGLLSHEERDRLIERGIWGLYRWYVTRSQQHRSWSPDHSFDWRSLRTDHSPELNMMIEGYFAVEQYVPDYTSRLIALTRKSHGRSHFQIRWGSEEEKHAELWLNTLLFLRHRDPAWISDYAADLRSRQWVLPWDDVLHMLCYTVVQERATQINYLNTAVIARGESKYPAFSNDSDPILAQVAKTIAVDEAAHYNFFLEGLRLHLYYYPAQTLEALKDVIDHFSMPAATLLPNWDELAELLYRGAIYGPRIHSRDVLQVALENIGLANRRALEEGIKRSRQVPDEHGHLRDTATFETLNYRQIEDSVKRLFDRIENYEAEIGLDQINPTVFVPSGLI